MEKPRVLVADSNSDFRNQCVQSLKRLDIEVVAEAADGQEAFAKIARTKPNVVVSDLYLGKIDGVGIIRSAKKQMPNTRATITKRPIYCIFRSYPQRTQSTGMSNSSVGSAGTT